jgi:hypothetical protein
LRAAHGDRVRIMADLEHLAHVIHMFAPGEDLAAIKPRRPYKPNKQRMTKTLLEVLRRANRPLKARELARMVMQAQGSDPRDHARMVSIACGLQSVLAKMAERGEIVISGKPRRWALARE